VSVADSSGQPSHSLVLPLTVVQDFSVNSSTSSQSINAGQTTGPYQLAVLPNPVGSAFNNAVTLSCPSGLPSGAACSFTPNPLPAGSNDVVMAISTAVDGRAKETSRTGLLLYALWLMMPGIVLFGNRESGLHAKHSPLLAGLGLVVLIALTLTSCGGGSNGGGGGGGGHQTKTYTVTVMGTGGGLSHSTTVALLVTQ
jgi:hypothetical protein